MRTKVGIWATAIMFAGSFGIVTAHATSASKASYRAPVEVTGCLEQGPAAKEYVLKANDGTTWGIRESGMLMNDYVDHEVTVSGDPIHPSTSERAAADAHHFMRAYDVAVESSSCQK
ncbi:MAG: hypothetical protein WBS19_06105 [Candidatus Korobacteraceae bacterium]